MKQVQKQEQNQQQNQKDCDLSDDSFRESVDVWTGTFPKLTNTLRAEVLAVLLASEDMTGTESIFAKSTTRLSTVIRALSRRYGWPIQRGDFATNTSDGRAAWASVYCLPQESIAQAFEMGAAAWVEEVRSARANRRQQASTRQATNLSANSDL